MRGGHGIGVSYSRLAVEPAYFILLILIVPQENRGLYVLVLCFRAWGQLEEKKKISGPTTAVTTHHAAFTHPSGGCLSKQKKSRKPTRPFCHSRTANQRPRESRRRKVYVKVRVAVPRSARAEGFCPSKWRTPRAA